MEIYHPKEEELIREMKRVRRVDRRKRVLIGLAILLILSIAAGIFVFHRYFQLVITHGAAMADTLPDGTVVLIRAPEPGTTYAAGDIILYEKRLAEPMEITAANAKGKIRHYCQFILYRDVGTTRQYFSTEEGTASWQESADKADVFDSDEQGILRFETEDLPDGDYFFKEIKASYGRDVLADPIPFTVKNPVQLQMKRVIGVPGSSVVLGATETRVNGQQISTAYTSGRTADASVAGRRVLVAKDTYFVQGDQLSLSVDSRDANYGVVSDEDIIGKAEFALWPVRCFGSLTGTQVTASGGGQGEAE